MQKKKETLLNNSKDIDVFPLPEIFFKKFKVTPVLEKDLQVIYNLENIIFENPWHLFDFTFFYSICHVKAVKIKDMILGYCIYRYEKGYNKIKNICHLLKIGVHPDFQNLGIGSLLLKDMFKSMKKKKSKVAYLEVRESNKNAINFYEKRGFFKSKIIENYYESGESAYLMIKINQK